MRDIEILGATENNLKSINVKIKRNQFTIITGVSGSGKSSLAFDTILKEAQRRFFLTLSYYSRQFLAIGTKPKVRQIKGLSPAVGLRQNEMIPSKKASVGSLIGANEMLGILFARFGSKSCPTHRLSTQGLSIEEIASFIMEDYRDEIIILGVAIAKNKKGLFAKELEAFATKGFLKVLLDGELVELANIPPLNKDRKHDLTLCIDFLRVGLKSESRLIRSLAMALELGSPSIEVIPLVDGRPLIARSHDYSTKNGCRQCGYSWPPLDTRHFSLGPLGQCTSCKGLGYDAELDDDAQHCQSCAGSGLKKDLEAIQIAGWSCHDFQLQPIEEVLEKLHSLKSGALQEHVGFKRLYRELSVILSRLQQHGLGYLQLARKVRSLSSGETQRLRFLSILGENLRDMIYVIDEPSQGLHESEVSRLVEVMRKLTDLGNTIICVDHDIQLMQSADWIIDLGPGGGANGGKILAQFKPAQASHYARISKTAENLSQEEAKKNSIVPDPPEHFISIHNPRLHNLKGGIIKIPQNKMTAIAGVSGAGKSTLMKVIRKTLEQKKPYFCDSYQMFELIEGVAYIDRSPLASRNGSFPATYLGIFNEIRQVFASTQEAQILGLSHADFSLQKKGARCEECGGKGSVSISMKFLPDAELACPVCKGKRYQELVESILFNGHSISQVLNLSLSEAEQLFQNHRKIAHPLKKAQELGLGYLKMGQGTHQLSGGENQRLRLVPYLARKKLKHHVLCIEEPTTGLHNEDTILLIASLKQMVRSGSTVVVIEHHPQVVESADWVIELGPGAGAKGGNIVYQGPVIHKG